jgi:catechol 2,3-dioxygenase-like lactoylglutathione lyase family enzyme
MRNADSSRDVIIRTNKWADALRFYGSVLGFTVASREAQIVGFETGAFRLYVEPGEPCCPA